MAQCKLCERSGWFLSVTGDGLCKSCAPIVSMEAGQRLRIINDCEKLIAGSKKLDTQLSRCDLLLQHAQALTRYEQRGIETTRPSPSELVGKYMMLRNDLILLGLEREFEEALRKAEVSLGIKSKINQLSKVRIKIAEFKSRIEKPAMLADLEGRVSDLVNQLQFNALLDDARKAEFKGQRKKALEKYYDALYFLRHDDIDDLLQSEHISSIEAKIVELGGETEPK